MKNLKTRFLLLVTMMIVSVVTYAYDVKIDGIYYNLDKDTKTAEVTNETGSGNAKSKTYKPKDKGQLEFYLEVIDRDIKRTNENPTIGMLLCPDADDTVVEYSLICIIHADYIYPLVNHSACPCDPFYTKFPTPQLFVSQNIVVSNIFCNFAPELRSIHPVRGWCAKDEDNEKR